ncbi:MAG: hypothetical protein DMD78_00060 [Candidatus Rokuibacteriota bacterium]|nr:MAG: hypothetical protein DMD78_00060 [Candidatus Rokubacteria bacterium]
MGGWGAVSGPPTKNDPPELRIYEIFEKNKGAFHARFRDHAARLMRRHGLRIVDMWESRAHERVEFVYLLEWKDEAALAGRVTGSRVGSRR